MKLEQPFPRLSLPPQAPAPRVYSYARFSTPEQAQGNSLERQMTAAAAWTERKNAERATHGLVPLTLDETLRLHDLGVSAYRGTNCATGGELGQFLEACRRGLVPPGSYLLVESFDRISRMVPRRAQRVIDDIVEAGVTICTLQDGQEFDETRLDTDPTALVLALMVAWRAHDESRAKGQRVAAAWEAKRDRFRTGKDRKLTKRAPSWLEWRNGDWCERSPHADTVRRIFEMTLRGAGEHKIAATLNCEGVPVMGRGKHWHRSTVSKLLRSRAVIGEMVPGKMDYSSGRRVRVLLEAVPGAFPPVVSLETWAAVRALKDGATSSVRGRGAGLALTNIFAGLARCPECGAAMTRVTKGSTKKAGRPKLVCTRAKVGASPHGYRTQCLDTLHAAFLNSWQALLADIPAGHRDPGADREWHEWSAVIDVTTDRLQTATESHMMAPSPATAALVADLRSALVTYRDNQERLEERRADADHGLAQARMGTLYDALHGKEQAAEIEVGEVNAALRTLFDAVTVDYRTGLLRFHWKQGGVAEIMFAWPTTADVN